MKGVRSFVEDLGRCFCRYSVQLCGAELRRASKQHSVNNNELHLEIQRPFKGKFGPLKRISEPLITKANESYGKMIQMPVCEINKTELRRARKQHSLFNNKLHIEIQTPFKGKCERLMRISEPPRRIIQPELLTGQMNIVT